MSPTTRTFWMLAAISALTMVAEACSPSGPARCRPEECPPLLCPPGPTPCEVIYYECWRLETLLTRARHQLNVGNVDDALQSLRTAHNIGWWDGRLQSLLGEVYLLQEKWQQAILALRRSTGSETDRRNLAEALTHTGWERYRWGKLDDAMRLWKEAEQNYPTGGLVLSSLGLGYLKQGDLKQAHVYCLRATEEQAAWPGGWFNLGLVCMSQGDLDEAENATRKGLKLAGDDAMGLNNLAFIRFERGDFGQAVELWKRSLDLDGSRADAWAGLGIGHWRAGDIVAAFRAYKRATVRDKTYLRMADLIADHYWSQGAARAAAELIEALNAH